MPLQVRKVIALVSHHPSNLAVARAARAIERWSGGCELTVLELRSLDEAPPAPGEQPSMLDYHLDPADPNAHPYRLGQGRPPRVLCTDDPAAEAAAEVAAQGADLIIVPEAGMPTQRLLRRVPCSILVTPVCEEAKGPVLAPVDRYWPRLGTLQFAAQLAAETKEPLELLQIYSVPIGYHKLGQTYDEVAAIMRGHAETTIADLLPKLSAPGLEIVTRLVLVKNTKSVAKAILEEAKARPYSQIVLGGRLRGRVVGVVFPSISERVVLSSPRPVWVIRDGSAPIGFVEAASS